MNYSSDDLKKIQAIEVEIAQEILRICKDNNLSYFTVGGTTLGAIRHNGFIPWDDDMDIGLFRSDYEKFLKLAPNQLTEGYILQHYTNERRTPTYHAKVMKEDTLFVEEYAAKIDIPHGVFVDIMPFDNIPIDQEELKRYRKKVKKYHQLFIAKSVWKTSLTRGRKKFLFTAIRSLLHVLMFPVPKDLLFNKLEKELKKYNSKETGRMSSRGLAVFECNKNDVFPTVAHRFEEIELQIPKDSDSLLKHQYGDYMQLPPENQRVGHAPKILKLGGNR